MVNTSLPLDASGKVDLSKLKVISRIKMPKVPTYQGKRVFISTDTSKIYYNKPVYVSDSGRITPLVSTAKQQFAQGVAQGIFKKQIMAQVREQAVPQIERKLGVGSQRFVKEQKLQQQTISRMDPGLQFRMGFITREDLKQKSKEIKNNRRQVSKLKPKELLKVGLIDKKKFNELEKEKILSEFKTKVGKNIQLPLKVARLWSKSARDLNNFVFRKLGLRANNKVFGAGWGTLATGSIKEGYELSSIKPSIDAEGREVYTFNYDSGQKNKVVVPSNLKFDSFAQKQVWLYGEAAKQAAKIGPYRTFLAGLVEAAKYVGRLPFEFAAVPATVVSGVGQLLAVPFDAQSKKNFEEFKKVAPLAIATTYNPTTLRGLLNITTTIALGVLATKNLAKAGAAAKEAKTATFVKGTVKIGRVSKVGKTYTQVIKGVIKTSKRKIPFQQKVVYFQKGSKVATKSTIDYGIKALKKTKPTGIVSKTKDLFKSTKDVFSGKKLFDKVFKSRPQIKPIGRKGIAQSRVTKIYNQRLAAEKGLNKIADKLAKASLKGKSTKTLFKQFKTAENKLAVINDRWKAIDGKVTFTTANTGVGKTKLVKRFKIKTAKGGSKFSEVEIGDGTTLRLTRLGEIKSVGFKGKFATKAIYSIPQKKGVALTVLQKGKQQQGIVQSLKQLSNPKVKFQKIEFTLYRNVLGKKQFTNLLVDQKTIIMRRLGLAKGATKTALQRRLVIVNNSLKKLGKTIKDVIPGKKGTVTLPNTARLQQVFQSKQKLRFPSKISDLRVEKIGRLAPPDFFTVLPNVGKALSPGFLLIPPVLGGNAFGTFVDNLNKRIVRGPIDSSKIKLKIFAPYDKDIKKLLDQSNLQEGLQEKVQDPVPDTKQPEQVITEKIVTNIGQPNPIFQSFFIPALGIPLLPTIIGIPPIFPGGDYRGGPISQLPGSVVQLARQYRYSPDIAARLKGTRVKSRKQVERLLQVGRVFTGLERRPLV